MRLWFGHFTSGNLGSSSPKKPKILEKDYMCRDVYRSILYYSEQLRSIHRNWNSKFPPSAEKRGVAPGSWKVTAGDSVTWVSPSWYWQASWGSTKCATAPNLSFSQQTNNKAEEKQSTKGTKKNACGFVSFLSQPLAHFPSSRPLCRVPLNLGWNCRVAHLFRSLPPGRGQSPAEAWGPRRWCTHTAMPAACHHACGEGLGYGRNARGVLWCQPCCVFHLAGGDTGSIHVQHSSLSLTRATLFMPFLPSEMRSRPALPTIF